MRTQVFRNSFLDLRDPIRSIRFLLDWWHLWKDNLLARSLALHLWQLILLSSKLDWKSKSRSTCGISEDGIPPKIFSFENLSTSFGNSSFSNNPPAADLFCVAQSFQPACRACCWVLSLTWFGLPVTCPRTFRWSFGATLRVSGVSAMYLGAALTTVPSSVVENSSTPPCKVEVAVTLRVCSCSRRLVRTSLADASSFPSMPRKPTRAFSCHCHFVNPDRI